jgi:hypothetical protein
MRLSLFGLLPLALATALPAAIHEEHALEARTNDASCNVKPIQLATKDQVPKTFFDWNPYNVTYCDPKKITLKDCEAKNQTLSELYISL